MGSKKLLSAYGRSVTGLLLGGLLWFVLGWALSGYILGALLALWVVVVGPICIPLLTWFWMRMRGHIQPLDMSHEHHLTQDYFASVLRKPGPRPRLWIRPASDLSLFWFETAWPGKSRQEVILTHAWMLQSREAKTEDWALLWDEIASLSPQERRMRSFRIAAWTGFFSPWEFFFQVLQIWLDILGFHDLPPAGFWFQRVAWEWRQMWFGTPREKSPILTSSTPVPLRAPSIWRSLIWGVWFQIPARSCHPSWALLTHSGAILGEAQSSAPHA